MDRTAVGTDGRERIWRPEGPLDVAATVGVLRFGPGDPAYRTTADGAVWRVSRTPGGLGTLRIAVRRAQGAVEARAWGPGAEWLLDRLPSLLGADDDPSGFDPGDHPLLRDVHRRHPGLRIGRTGLVLESLVPAVLGQRVTVGEAHHAWRELLLGHGAAAPGPAPAGMRAAPAARDWAMIPSWDWHRARVDGKRSAAVVRVARLAARLERASVLPAGEAAALLTTVPGIGVWTAAETLQRSNGDADAVTVGDLHLPNTVGWALAGRERSDDGVMLELLEPYRGHRHRVCRLLRLTSVRAPRHAPRYAPIDFRAM
ncbi:DNA-3-methyladenine glycosylase [Streptacidiphilus sp. EB129]|uniref:DNA-3-methyladenine glycosylase family protein n=1 Tax=Streptacidiphilus sp. EB129 TaxID=3156262 RepID=UPI003516045A